MVMPDVFRNSRLEQRIKRLELQVTQLAANQVKLSLALAEHGELIASMALLLQTAQSTLPGEKPAERATRLADDAPALTIVRVH